MWHGDPTIYKPTDINPFSKKTYGELYKETIEREEIIKNNNFNFIISMRTCII